MKHITAYMAGIALFFPIKIIVALDSAYFKTYKTTSTLCVSMPFIAKDYKTFGDWWRAS